MDPTLQAGSDGPPWNIKMEAIRHYLVNNHHYGPGRSVRHSFVAADGANYEINLGNLVHNLRNRQQQLTPEQRSDLTDMRSLGWEWNGNIDTAKRKMIQASGKLHTLQEEERETQLEIERQGEAVTATSLAKIRRLVQEIKKTQYDQNRYEVAIIDLREQESKDLCGIDTFSESTVHEQRSIIKSPTHLSHLEASFLNEEEPIAHDASPINDVKTYSVSEDCPRVQDAPIPTKATAGALANILVPEPETKSFAEENKENMASAANDDWVSKLSSVYRRAAFKARSFYEGFEKEAAQLIEPVRDATATHEMLEPELSKISGTQSSRLLTPGNQAADVNVTDFKMYNAFSSSHAGADLSSIPEQPSTAESPAAAKVCTGRHPALLMNVGDLVITHSLKNANYNNARGQLVDYTCETARWRVELLSHGDESDRFKSFKEENLKICPETRAPSISVLDTVDSSPVVADVTVLTAVGESAACKLAVGIRAVVHGLEGMGDYHNGKLVQIEEMNVNGKCRVTLVNSTQTRLNVLSIHPKYLTPYIFAENPLSGTAAPEKSNKDQFKDLPDYEFMEGKFSVEDVANRISIFDKELCVKDPDGDYASEFYQVHGNILVRTLPVENQVIIIRAIASCHTDHDSNEVVLKVKVLMNARHVRSEISKDQSSDTGSRVIEPPVTENDLVSMIRTLNLPDSYSDRLQSEEVDLEYLLKTMQNQGAEQLKKELADFGIEKMVHRGKIANFLLEEMQKSTQEKA